MVSDSWLNLCPINWDYALDCIYQSDVACRVLTDLLAKRVPVAYAAFLENRCLQFIGNRRFREVSSVPFVREYVAGIFAMQCGSDGVVDAAMLQQHIDYLHNPINLFTAVLYLGYTWPQGYRSGLAFIRTSRHWFSSVHETPPGMSARVISVIWCKVMATTFSANSSYGLTLSICFVHCSPKKSKSKR